MFRYVFVFMFVLGFFACNDEVENPGLIQFAEPGEPCVADLQCASGLCSDSICAARNTLPVADAGPNRVTLVGIPVTVDGSSSVDPDDPENADALTYAWSLLSTPADAEATLSETDQPVISFTGTGQGVYELQLAVTDTREASATSTVVVFVLDQDGSFTLPEGANCIDGIQCASGKCEEKTCQNNQAPVAKGGTSRTVPVGQLVELDGSGSSDLDGDALTYTWSLTQSPEGATAALSQTDTPATSFTPQIEGLYVVRLWVNDGWLNSVPDTIGIMAVAEESSLLPDGEECSEGAECESQFCFQDACATNAPPVADAGKAVIVQVGTEVAIDGTGSTDPEGMPLTYSWSLHEVSPLAPATTSAASIVDPTAASSSFTPDVPGVYVLRLVVNDGMLDSVPADLVVYADAEPVNLAPNGDPCTSGVTCQSQFCLAGTCATNAPPIADAGPIQFVPVGAEVTVDGSASLDPEDVSLTFVWSLTETPEGTTATLTAPTDAATSFVADVEGSYTLSLTVSDGQLESADTVVVVAGVQGTGGKGEGESCQLDSECSTGYCSDAGLCTVNLPPTAIIATPSNVYLGDDVSFDGTASQDPEESALAFSWALLTQPESSTATLSGSDGTATLTTDTAGAYTVGLVVNDGHQDSSQALAVVIVEDPVGKPNGTPCTDNQECASGFCDATDALCTTNLPPMAVITAVTSADAGTMVSLNGEASTDDEGAMLTYAWVLESAPTGLSGMPIDDPAVPSPNIIVELPGAYVVSLVVNDGFQDSPKAFHVIEALPSSDKPDGTACSGNGQCLSGYCEPVSGTCAPNAVPTAVVTSNSPVDVGTTVTLDGSDSTDDESPSLTYTWLIEAFPAGSNATITNAAEATATFVPDVAGAYTVSLVVNDGYLDSPKTVHVVVANSTTGAPDGSSCTAAVECASGYCDAGGSCATNTAPVAVIDTTATAELSAPITLDGSGSSDAEDHALTYQWSLQDAPVGSVATIQGAATESATLTPDVTGVYLIALTVNDGYTSSSPAYKAISVVSAALLGEGAGCTADGECSSGFCHPSTSTCAVNTPPTATINSDSTADTGSTVALDGTSSSDPETSVQSYTWTIVSAPAGSTATLGDPAAGATNFDPDVPGTYVIALVVHDGYTSSAVTYQVVTVTEPPLLAAGEACVDDAECASGYCDPNLLQCAVNAPPTASIATDLLVELGATSSLDGSASSDADMQSLTYDWFIESAPAGSNAVLADSDQATAAFTPDGVGTYIIGLTVNDGYAASLPSYVAVNVVDPAATGNGTPCSEDGDCISGYCAADQTCATNTIPSASVDGPSSVALGDTVNLDGTASNDAETQPLTYTWTLHDAPENSTIQVGGANQASAFFTPDVSGIYVVSLTVNDGYDDSLPTFLTIDVAPPALLSSGETCADDAECASDYCHPTLNQCANNIPPTASIQTSDVVVIGETATLDGSTSADSELQTLTYTWTLVDQPAGSTVTLSNADQELASLTPDVGGTYLVELVVNDGKTDSTPQYVVITATSAPPASNGSACTTDGECTSDFCSPLTSLCADNAAPVAVIVAGDTATIGVLHALDGSSSVDPEGATLTHTWSLLDAPAGSIASISSPNAVQASLTTDVAGPFVVGLQVSDGQQDSVIATLVITSSLAPDGAACSDDDECLSGFCLGNVCTTNTPPVADIADLGTSIVVDNPLSLSAAGSTDSDGSGLTYSWVVLSQPDGSSATIEDPSAATTSITPDAEGTWVFGLVVDDGYDSSVLATGFIEVTPAPGNLINGAPCLADLQCASGYCGQGACQCRPISCSALGDAPCGTVDNGCGDLLDCGSCGAGETCNLSTNQCVCSALSCVDLGYTCGTWDDGCGGTLSCGSCPGVASGQGSNTCGASGTCEVTCNTGFDVCDGDCIDPLSDAQHCGGCNVDNCGTQPCVGGVCEEAYTLSILSGDGQTTGLAEPAPQPLVVQVLDATSQPVVDLPLTTTASEGAFIGPSSTLTDASGVANFQVWPGLQPGTYSFTIEAGPEGNTLNATVIAELSDGRSYPIVNHQFNDTGTVSANLPGPSHQVEISNINSGGLAVGSDDSVYVSSRDTHTVIQISPLGHAQRVAGIEGSKGTSGDGGPALEAQLDTPYGVEVDVTKGLLYILQRPSSQGSGQIRTVDLATGVITHFAGGGSSGGANGDGGPAATAYLDFPYKLRLAPNGDLYITERRRVRVIRDGVIDHFIGRNFDPLPSCSNYATSGTEADPIGGTIDWCEGDICDVGWAPDGSTIVSGRWCNADNDIPWGVMRVAPDGTRYPILGNNNGTTEYGVRGLQHRILEPRAMAVDAQGNVFLTTGNASNTQNLIRLDAQSRIVTEVAGGPHGTTAHYGPIGDVLFSNIVRGLDFDSKGDLYVADGLSFGVFALGGLGNAPSTSITLGPIGGNLEAHTITTVMTPQPEVELLDGDGQPLVGTSVTFSSGHPGVYPQQVAIPVTAPGATATFTGRMGFGFEPVEVFAEYRDIFGNHVSGSPVTFNLTPVAPADNQIFTVVNTQMGASTGTVGPATAMKLNSPNSSCTGPDGSIFVADTENHRVVQMTPQGDGILIAGNGSAGYSGEDGFGPDAQLRRPRDCAFDASTNILYVSDSENRVIRGVDMATGLIFRFAGKGTQTTYPFGDNGHRLDAVFPYASSRMALSDDGAKMYFIHQYTSIESWVREIDMATGVIRRISEVENGCVAPGHPRSFVAGDHNLHVGPGPAYDLYFAGNICSQTGGSTTVGGVSRFDRTQNVWVPVTSPTDQNSGQDGFDALSTSFPTDSIDDVMVTSDGSIFLANSGLHRIRKIDAAGMVSTIVGDGVAGFEGEFVDATTARVSRPRALAMHPDGHLVITSQDASAVRIIWRSCTQDSDCKASGTPVCDVAQGACVSSL